MGTIFIKGLLLEASIGIYPQEKTAKQPLLIDIELSKDLTVAAKSGHIKDTVDYDLVMDRISLIVDGKHYNLLETLGNDIVSTILHEFDVSKVRCTLSKPRAVTNAEAVGVVIETAKNQASYQNCQLD